MNNRRCIKCGQCMSVCPVYNNTRNESDVARGKLALIENINDSNESIDSDQLSDTKKAILRCVLCGACSNVCGNKVPTTDMILDFLSKEFKKTPFLINSLSNPNLLSRIIRKSGYLIQGLIAGQIPQTSGLRLRFPINAFTKRTFIPKLARKPFLKNMPDNNAPDNKVAFFVGCGTNFLFPEIGASLIGLFDKLGQAIVIPKNQVCCGLPFHSVGDKEFARTLAKQNIEIFEQLSPNVILTTCASCGSHIKNHWASLLEDDPTWFRRASAIASLQNDATSYLVENLKLDQYIKTIKAKKNSETTEKDKTDNKNELKVVYHDPCHLRIGQNRNQSSQIKLLEAAGFDIVSVSNTCCGHGGKFNINNYKLSMDILSTKLAEILPKNPDYIVTSCTGCQIQFSDGMLHNNMETDVCHILALIDNRLNHL